MQVEEKFGLTSEDIEHAVMRHHEPWMRFSALGFKAFGCIGLNFANSSLVGDGSKMAHVAFDSECIVWLYSAVSWQHDIQAYPSALNSSPFVRMSCFPLVHQSD